MAYKNKRNRTSSGNTAHAVAGKKTKKFAAANSAEVLENSRGRFPLTKFNFVLMAISWGLVVIGFILMLGGSTTEAGFNEDIFSTRRIIIGPTITFIGFVAMVYAIMSNRKSFKGKKEVEKEPEVTENEQKIAE